MKIKTGQGKILMSKLASFCGGELCGEDRSFSFVCTDSREADRDTLFVAMRGERVDGHNFIEKAMENGCECVLCEHVPTGLCGLSVVSVKDSVKALSLIAREARREENRRTVAITGSVGKTTTKEMVSAALMSKRLYKTEGNYNSVIGLPLSMLEMPTDTEIAVLEMGMSGFSEIESMSLAATPDIAIVTNIGSSHLEMLGSRENIRRAKLEIVAGLKEDGVLLINGDDPMLWGFDTSVRTMSVGTENENCDFYATRIKADEFGTAFTVVFPDKTRESCYISHLGNHNVRAALFGLAVAYLFGIDAIIAKNGVASFKGTKMRQNIYRAGEFTFIEDCYNASPESMRAAIDVAVSQKKTRTVALLGDMKELGEGSPELHIGVGKYAAEKGIDLIFTYGELAKNIGNGAESGGCRVIRINNADPETAANVMLSELLPDDVVLFKASRSMKAENVINTIKERMGIKDDE